MKKLLILTAALMVTTSIAGCRCGPLRTRYCNAYQSRCNACTPECDSCDSYGSGATYGTPPVIDGGYAPMVLPGEIVPGPQ